MNRWITALVLVVVVACAGGVQAAIITAISESGGEPEGIHKTGDTYSHVDGNVEDPHTVPAFGEDALTFTDRDHEYNGVTAAGLPARLVGGDYIQTANDARDNANYQLNVTLGELAHLFIIRDNRKQNSLPDWFSDGVGLDFLVTADDVGYDEDGRANGTIGPGSGINQTGSVYVAINTATGSAGLEPGVYTLYQSETAGNNMYGVVASVNNIPEPSTLAIWALGLLALAMAGRRRRAK